MRKPKEHVNCKVLQPNFHLLLSCCVFFLAFTSTLPVTEGCPLKCTCTQEKPPSKPFGMGVTSLLWGITIEPSTTVNPELVKQNISINCPKADLGKLFREEDLNGVDPGTVVRIDLSWNRIRELANFDFKIFPALHSLKLSNNKLTRIEPNAFDGLKLKELVLDSNLLQGVPQGLFPSSLEQLSLEDNFLTLVPHAATSSLHLLNTLNLAGNKISVVREGDFRGLKSLTVLNLDENEIGEIEERALAGIPKLKTLDLTSNKLKEIPSSVLLCPKLVHLHLANNLISWISEDALQKLTSLEDLLLNGNPFEKTHVDAFRHLPRLKKLILTESWQTTEFPNLDGTSSLELIRIDRASIKRIPENLCQKTPKLKSLVLHRNQISEIPKMGVCSHLRLIDLSNNEIKEIVDLTFSELGGLEDLLLQNNQIEEVTENSFKGLDNLQVLNLESNLITLIHPLSFTPLKSLEDINLGNNFFPDLPSRGFDRVVSFKAHNNRHLKEFPDPASFPSVHSLVLSYAYHCCPFLSLKKPSLFDGETTGIIEDVVFNVDGLKGLDPTFWNVSSVWPDIGLDNTKQFEAYWANLAADFSSTESDATTAPFLGTTTTMFPSSANNIECIPTPGPFMPCKDLFDWWTLRCGVWIVFLLALLGNGAVVIVLIFARAKMDVPRFLVTNLAFADFFMGIYLGFLAVVDASTLGEFRMYAIPWQMSVGCQTAGFFGVLSSELSVYTLTVITLERNYAITHAMHLNKRLSLRHAAYIMSAGWAFSITMAVLPIFGISDYRKFAVCLPFETDGGGLAYVIFIMFINGIAFLILMGCYLKIYCAIRGSQAWNSNDSRIAKRMALLVFTDFLCWAPIAFLSLTAASGIRLISLEEAKIFTIFILPLNSCCNPFLYALLTKQFKKDCVMLCKTIEESRVTRGIGRCRHSSNFSNRQTPVNTNSAVDPASKGENQMCMCHNKLKEHRKLKNRLRMAAVKYFLCHRNTREINSGSDYSYQQNKTVNIGKRNASLSSEAYSSSWSDTFRKSNMAMSLRILDKRRPNSWLLSRKPSQDSNLSSSRNDSSATTASTSTWRISRSSVSSDISSAGSKGHGKLELQNSGKIGSIRRTDGRLLHNRINQPSQVLVMQNNAATGTWVSSLIRGKPKLQRQPGFERESYINKKSDIESPFCPLHHRPENLSCVYEQESYEEDETQYPPDSKLSYLSPNCHNSGVKMGFLSRKLSTISSHSISVTKDGNVDEHESPIKEEAPRIVKVSPSKENIFMENGRCASLNMISQSPLRYLSGRCPSEGQLHSHHQQQYERPASARSIDCVRFPSSETNEGNPYHPSPVCTETTALMASDSEDDDVFLEDGRRRPFETHFPIEGEPEENFIIKESS